MNSKEVQENIRDHYLSPLNFGKPSWDADKVVSVENPTCGDSLTLYIKFEGNLVDQIAFDAQGCSISIASASILYEELKGKSISDITISEQSIYEMLGFTPTTSRKNCALLSLDAFKKITQK